MSSGNACARCGGAQAHLSPPAWSKRWLHGRSVDLWRFGGMMPSPLATDLQATWQLSCQGSMRVIPPAARGAMSSQNVKSSLHPRVSLSTAASACFTHAAETYLCALLTLCTASISRDRYDAARGCRGIHDGHAPHALHSHLIRRVGLAARAGSGPPVAPLPHAPRPPASRRRGMGHLGGPGAPEVRSGAGACMHARASAPASVAQFVRRPPCAAMSA